MSRVRSGRRALLAMVAAAALILTAVLFYQVGSGRAPAASPPARPTPSPTRTPTTAEIYTAVAPSVVSIDAVRAGPTTTEAGGTGIVVNADGTIVTALHVVNGATALTVTFADGTASPATVAATAPPSTSPRSPPRSCRRWWYPPYSATPADSPSVTMWWRSATSSA